MRCKYVGYKEIDYVSKKTGKPVKGKNLYITYPADNVVGIVAEDIYVSSLMDITGLVIGQEMDVFFNRYGSVEQILPVAK